MTTISDGKGTSVEAQVDSSHRLRTFSIVESEDKSSNRNGETWSINQSTTAVGTDDIVFYLKNTGEATLALTDIRAFCGAASTLTLKVVSGTPSYAAGVALTPVNRNLGSSKTISATIYEDTNTTGLTEEGDLFFIRCDTANEERHLKTSSNVIIPQGTAIALSTSAATAVTTLISINVLES